MKSILILFQSIFTYLSFIAMLFPIFSIINAWKRGLIKDFDLKLFALLVVIGFIVQYSINIFAWYMYLNEYSIELFWLTQDWVFIIYIFFQTTIIVQLFLKWANLKKYFLPVIFTSYVLLIAGDYFSHTAYPDLMSWISCAIILLLSFIVSYKIDVGEIKDLKPEYNYLIVGTYLFCMISVLGITPNQTDLRNLGHVLHCVAVVVAHYYYFLAFRSLYKRENLSIITNT